MKNWGLTLEAIDAEAVREGLVEAEKRLDSLLALKKEIDDKALSLLRLHIIALAGIFSLLTVSLFQDSLYADVAIIGILMLAVCTAFAASAATHCLRISNYGVKGEIPEFWLQEDVLRRAKDTKASNASGAESIGRKELLVRTLDSYNLRIKISDRSNGEKTRYLRQAIVWQLRAIIVAAIFVGASGTWLASYGLYTKLYLGL
ncbi:MAG: hypothetical protein ACR2PW_06115 [Gammaproteobacteria bacterium]